jgi:AhpD family alkylhydroperoxidase
MTTFKRRIYPSFSDFLADLRWPLRHRAQMRRAMGGELVSPQFRERLMMAVTAVNQCRYCSYYHARESLRVGLSSAEIRRLNDGLLEGAPDEEMPALLYAQAWAEADGRVAPELRDRLVEIYGAERAEAIETVLQMIRTGNLLGNSFDWFLSKLSWGRLGHTAAEKAGR